jgi:hypothetical protein
MFAGNLAVTYAHVTPGYTVHTSSPWYYWEAYNVLGDGSLMPYNTQALNNSVSHLPVIPLGMNIYTVNAVPGSYVAISKDGVILGVAVADALGVANVSFQTPLASVGQVDLVITRNHYKPYIEQIMVAPLDGAFVTYDSFNLVSGADLTYIAENCDIAVTLKNVGNSTTTDNLSITFSCSDSQLTINSGAVSCNSIAAGSTTTVILNVTVAHDIPDNKIFPLTVTVNDNAQHTWESSIPLKAFAPKLMLKTVLINNIENGSLEPGNVASIRIKVVNIGHADAYDIVGQLGFDSEYLSVACETTTQHPKQMISVGESVVFDFLVFSDPLMPSGYTSSLFLLVEGNYDLKNNLPFNLSAVDYCFPDNTGCDDNDKFVYVKCGEIENTNTACSENGYSDFTNMTTQLVPGQQYEITVKTGYGKNNVKGWIDFNGNNVFDAGEAVVNLVCESSNTAYSQTFTVPESAVAGHHRFRLRTKYDSTPNICDGFTYGQTHDYTIVIPETLPRPQNVVAQQENLSSIKLSWKTPEGAAPSGYNLYRNGKRLNTTTITSNSFIENNITDDVCVYQITALSNIGKESLPATSNFVCFIQTCETVVNLLGTSDKDIVTLAWEDAETSEGNVLGYNVYRDGVKINNTLITARNYQDVVLNNGTYTYQVTAYYEHCQETSLSSPVIVTVNITSVTLLDADAYLVFPNPASHSVTVQGKDMVRIEIYDIAGRQLSVYNNLNGSLTIENVEQYQSGMYFIKIYTGNHFITKRLAIVR